MSRNLPVLREYSSDPLRVVPGRRMGVSSPRACFLSSRSRGALRHLTGPCLRPKSMARSNSALLCRRVQDERNQEGAGVAQHQEPDLHRRVPHRHQPGRPRAGHAPQARAAARGRLFMTSTASRSRCTRASRCSRVTGARTSPRGRGTARCRRSKPPAQRTSPRVTKALSRQPMGRSCAIHAP